MKSQKLLAVLLLLPVIAQAAFDTPLALPPDVRADVYEQRQVGALFAVNRTRATADLARLQGDDSALDGQVMAILAGTARGDLHLSRQGQPLSFAEQFISARRDGRPVDYSNACVAVPRAGDTLSASYAAGTLTVSVELRVVDYVGYRYENSVPIKVQPGSIGTCARETGAQVYYLGTLVASDTKKTVLTQPVVGYVMRLGPR